MSHTADSQLHEIMMSAERLLQDRFVQPHANDAETLQEEAWIACADQGWFSLGLDQSKGGLGLGAMAETVLYRSIGSHLAAGPFLGTTIAAWIASVAGADDAVAQLVSGERRVGVLNGAFAIDAESGGWVIALGSSQGSIRSVRRLEPVPCVDPSVRLHRVDLGDDIAQAEEVLLQPHAWLLVAAMQLGIAEKARDASVAYAKARTQFGRPIGSFQAVKHRCADMEIRCHIAAAQLSFAAHCLDGSESDVRFQAAAAWALANAAAKENTADNIQNHGALGFTEENGAGRYLKRAHVLEYLLGPPRAVITALLDEKSHDFLAM